MDTWARPVCPWHSPSMPFDLAALDAACDRVQAASTVLAATMGSLRTREDLLALTAAVRAFQEALARAEALAVVTQPQEIAPETVRRVVVNRQYLDTIGRATIALVERYNEVAGEVVRGLGVGEA